MIKKKSQLGKSENIVGLLFIAFPILSMLLFTFLPVIMSAYLSFTYWSGYNSIWNAEWIGFSNFKDLFGGVYTKELFQSVLNTVIMMISVPIGLILALVLATALNKKVKGSQVFRVIYYIPVIANLVAVSIIFKQLFSDNGTINSMLNIIGISPVKWLNNKGTVKIVLVIMLGWRNLGYNMLLYLAALQGVSKEYYEAAKLDGAGPVKIFVKITMPLIQPMTFFMLVTGIMGGLQIYTEPSVMFAYTSGKGPEGGAMTIMTQLYYFFNEGRKVGLASATAWILTFMIFFVTAVQFYFNKRRDKIEY